MIRVFKSDNQGDEFYAMMGRYFASLDIAKELERQVYNKPNTHWLINKSAHSLAVFGFVSVHETMTSYFIDNLYVPPDHRQVGVASGLIRKVCELYDNKTLKCIACNPYAMSIFERFGFVEVGSRGKYKRLEKHKTGVLPL